MERTERDARDLLVERVRTTLDATGEAFPYVADPETGAWTTTADGNWCGGHWVGLLWRAHGATGEERFATAAREHARRMADRMPRECMFVGMNFHYAGFRAGDPAGDDEWTALGIEGADATRAYFHEGARQVPLGVLEIDSPAPEFRGPETGDAPSGAELGAVDAVYTALPVLWRAFRETGDPRYRDVAVSHADRHLDWYVRPDGRTWHHAQFDPGTGDLVRQYNELAYSEDTCWARGQGWCIAGLARAYAETGAGRYLDALRQVVDYYVEHSPPDLVPGWDLAHPDAPDVNRDTSCAALVAYGLSRPSPDALADLPEDLIAVGERVLAALVEGYLTPRVGREDEDADRPRGMVLEGCYNGPSGFADRNELVWTDYYLLETLAARLDA